MEYCSAHIRDIHLLPNGKIVVTIAACNQCEECLTYTANYRSRRIVRLIWFRKCTKKWLEWYLINKKCRDQLWDKEIMSCCQLKDAKCWVPLKIMCTVSNMWKLSASLSNSDPRWMIVGQISEADVRNVPEKHPKENMLDKPNWVRGLSDEEEILTWEPWEI